MGTYNLPRNVKGEGRILIFSYKTLGYIVVGLVIGYLIYLPLSYIGLSILGYIIMGILALLGFALGTLKIPETSAFQITKQLGGENLDEIVKRAILFKLKKNKIYVYTEDNKNEEEEDIK